MKFLKRLFAKLWQSWSKTLDNFLLHHSHACEIVTFIGALAFLVLGAYEARQLSSLAAKLLSLPREAIPQQFGALESLVLDGFDSAIPVQPWPESVAKKMNDIQQALKQPHSLGTSVHLQLLLQGGQGSIRDQYLTDDNHKVGLFLPAIALSGVAKGSAPLKATAVDLNQLVAKAPQTAKDLAASAEIAPLLQQMAKEAEHAGGMLQVYFLTTTGILRIYSDAGVKVDNYNPHRFFPERPYFWATLEREKPSAGASANPFTYWTRPYVDLGGHGIVRTMCKPVSKGTDLSEAAVCADVGFPEKETKETVTSEIRAFRMDPPKEIRCTLPDRQDNGFTPPANCWETEQATTSKLAKLVVEELGDPKTRERTLGGIHQLAGSPDPAWPVRVFKKRIRRIPYLGTAIRFLLPLPSSGPFYFTVPLSISSIATKPGQQAKFLICAVDFGLPAMWLVVAVSGASLCSGCLLLCLFYSFQAKRKAQSFIASLEQVMEINPVPFVHLSEEWKIVGSNVAFERLIGFSKAELKERKFESILTTSSQARHAAVAQLRQKRLWTRPYELILLTINQVQVTVVVCGSMIDMPRTSKLNAKEPADTFLHTFGVIVPKAQLADEDLRRLQVLGLDLSLPEFKELLGKSAKPAG